MTDYTKSTNFASKDSLSPGSALKIVRGTEIDTEFNNIATAVATKANSSDVTSSLATKADLASPALTGTPTAPTPTAGDNDTSIATTAFVTTAVAALGYPAFKNRIINGAMMIDQRNAGASVTLTSSNAYNLDRWYARAATGSSTTAIQSTTVPSNYKNSLLITVGTGASPGTTDNNYIAQRIEGLNMADFGWGTATASTVTLSFWVRSSLGPGTFGGAIQNSDVTRSYPFTYTISAANTWEQKSVTIAGDTSGTWLTTTGIGMTLTFDLGTGATYQGTAGAWASADYRAPTGAVKTIAASGATFYITGVQLEKGSTATSFDYRPYGTELALCQRYFIKYGGTNIYEYVTPYGMTYVAGSNFVTAIFPVEMRAAPSVSFSTLRWTWQGASATVTGVAVELPTSKVCGLVVSTGGGETAYRSGVVTANNSTAAYLNFSAEL